MSLLPYKFPWSRRVTAIGLDLDASGVRLIELSRSRGNLRVEHFAFEPLAHGAFREGGGLQSDQVSEAIHIALIKSGSRTRDTALALPASSVISKIITLPEVLSEDEIEAEIQAEASQNLPFAISEIGLDFFILGTSAREQASIDVMLVAARKEKIDERIAWAQMAGLHVVSVSVDVYAARIAMTEQFKREKIINSDAIGLYQIGSEQSHFSVFARHTMVYERTQGFGSYKLKHDLYKNNESAQNELIHAFNELAAQELSRALQLFFSSSMFGKLTHLYIAGDALHIAELESLLLCRMDMPVAIVNPFSDIRISSTVNQSALEAQSSACLVATGLALSALRL